MALRAGQLRNRVEIWRNAETDNGKGGFTSGWSRFRTVWAEVIGQSGREAVIAHALQGISVYRIRIRYRSDMRDSDQLRYGSVDLNIKSLIDPDGRREQLVILADTESVQTMPPPDAQ